MHSRALWIACLLALTILVSSAHSRTNPKDRINIRDVKVLSLYNGQKTAGRRARPVPQLKCVGGDAAHDTSPEVIQCRQIGMNGNEAQWECKTELDKEYRLGTTVVTCEGYDYPDDPYILDGSCGVEYTLHRTSKYKKPSSKHTPDAYSDYSHPTDDDHTHAPGSPWWSSFLPTGTAPILSWFMNNQNQQQTPGFSDARSTRPQAGTPWWASFLPPGVGPVLSWVMGSQHSTSWYNRFPFSMLFGAGSRGGRYSQADCDLGMYVSPRPRIRRAPPERSEEGWRGESFFRRSGARGTILRSKIKCERSELQKRLTKLQRGEEHDFAPQKQ
ncbi:hypothetical protein DFS34DRAFT_591115 [Phlyctochytrium arcticum]|nr:hypothetical protein DFS34DRAFT_591115 [Phlyctochytrium arcticum]